MGLVNEPGALHFFDLGRGLVLVGDRDGSAILTTKDGGKTWSQAVSLGPGAWRELFVLDEDHAWVAGSKAAPEKPRGRSATIRAVTMRSRWP